MIKTKSSCASSPRRTPSGWMFLLCCVIGFGVGLLISVQFRLVLHQRNPAEARGRLLIYGDSIRTAEDRDVTAEVAKTHEAIQYLGKSIATLQMEVAAKRSARELPGRRSADGSGHQRKKPFVVIGIITAFSGAARRDLARQTWMLRGEELKKLEEEKGVVIRFVIGHSGVSNNKLDKAIDAEDDLHHDFLRLDHAEGYNKLPAKTMIFFSTAVALWDAEFFVKVDDDIHANIGKLVTTLGRHKLKPRVYIGCMKSGKVFAHNNTKYNEPEFRKFGEEGNKYFLHAGGGMYAISKDLATYISINQPILHKYANEDVSLGAWLIGLDVEHVDERGMCCGTLPGGASDCEVKARAGNACIASYDLRCTGVCNLAERLSDVHSRCGEGDDAIWNASV